MESKGVMYYTITFKPLHMNILPIILMIVQLLYKFIFIYNRNNYLFFLKKKFLNLTYGSTILSNLLKVEISNCLKMEYK